MVGAHGVEKYDLVMVLFISHISIYIFMADIVNFIVWVYCAPCFLSRAYWMPDYYKFFTHVLNIKIIK